MYWVAERSFWRRALDTVSSAHSMVTSDLLCEAMTENGHATLYPFGTSVPAWIALPSERQHQSCNSQPDKNDHYYNPWSVNTRYKHARHRKRDQRRDEDGKVSAEEIEDRFDDFCDGVHGGVHSSAFGRFSRSRGALFNQTTSAADNTR